MTTKYEKLKNRNKKRQQSPLEKWVLRFFPEAKIYDYELEYQVDYYFIDIAWPQLKYGVELDGLNFHCSPKQVDKDVKKDLYLQKKGWEIKRILSNECWNPKLLAKHLLEIKNKINSDRPISWGLSEILGINPRIKKEKEIDYTYCKKCGDIGLKVGIDNCRCGNWKWKY